MQAPRVSLVEQHELRVLDVAIERERQIHDRKLQALRDEHRHHLDGRRVVVQPAGVFGRAAPLVALRAQPIAQRGQAEVFPVRGLLQQLSHVRQVRHEPLAALPRQHAVAHARDLRGLEDRGDTTVAGVTGPLPQRFRDPVRQRVTARGQRLRRHAEEHRRRGGPHHPGTVRLVERLQQAQPVLGGVRPEDVGVAGVDRRDACFNQRVVTGAGVHVLLDDHRDVPRPDRLAIERGAACQQVADVGGHVGGYV